MADTDLVEPAIIENPLATLRDALAVLTAWYADNDDNVAQEVDDAIGSVVDLVPLLIADHARGWDLFEEARRRLQLPKRSGQDAEREDHRRIQSSHPNPTQNDNPG